MAFTDFLFNGSPPPATTTLQQNNTSLPEWYQAYNQGLLSKTNAVIDQPYTPYQGPRVAGLTPDQQASQAQVEGSIGIQDPYNNAAAGALTQAADPSLNSDVFSSYMSPYIGGVVDQIGRLGGRNLSEHLLPAVNDTFTKAGQFGSSRNEEFTNRALRDTNQDILNAQSNALEQSYNNAMTNYGQGQYRGLMGGQQLGALGQVSQAEALKGAAALDASGQEQQQNTQQSFDTAHQDFLNQRDWDKTQLSFMNSMLRGIQAPTATSSSSLGPSSSYSASPLAQVAGLGLGAASLGKALNSQGGRIRKARGGAVSPDIGAVIAHIQRIHRMKGGRAYQYGPVTLNPEAPAYG